MNFNKIDSGNDEGNLESWKGKMRVTESMMRVTLNTFIEKLKETGSTLCGLRLPLAAAHIS